jgi:hypothetical protein
MAGASVGTSQKVARSTTEIRSLRLRACCRRRASAVTTVARSRSARARYTQSYTGWFRSLATSIIARASKGEVGRRSTALPRSRSSARAASLGEISFRVAFFHRALAASTSRRSGASRASSWARSRSARVRLFSPPRCCPADAGRFSCRPSGSSSCCRAACSPRECCPLRHDHLLDQTPELVAEGDALGVTHLDHVQRDDISSSPTACWQGHRATGLRPSWSVVRVRPHRSSRPSPEAAPAPPPRGRAPPRPRDAPP